MRRLQWVHGPRTVVITAPRRMAACGGGLQWVHGPRTVVIRHRQERLRSSTRRASMGPRSENRGYPSPCLEYSLTFRQLQWVHGPRTVVISNLGQSKTAIKSFNGSTVREPWLSPICFDTVYDCKVASMGPRSENRGYQGGQPLECQLSASASMGPRSENRGYLHVCCRLSCLPCCFNGSTVREPWLSCWQNTGPMFGDMLQWVHGPRTVVITCTCEGIPQASHAASMGPRSENRGYRDALRRELEVVK